MYGTSVSANNLCHMALVAKPERDSAKHRYKLIECMQVASWITYSIEVPGKMIKKTIEGLQSILHLQFKKSWGHV